jgi:zinc protease
VGGEAAWTTPDGMRVLLEESHALPLVDFQLVLCTGSVHDPEGFEGLTRVLWRMIRMGTKSLRGPEVEEAIARLGARLSIDVSTSFVAIHGAVIRRNLEPFLELVASLLRSPAFRTTDLKQVRREHLAELVALRDSDRSLAARSFRRLLFAGHPYGRPVTGTERTLRRIARDDLVTAHARHFVGRNLVLGVAGDLTPPELESLIERHLSGLSRKKPPADRVPAPKRPRGRRVLVVDKPDRAQTQVFIGTLGSKAGDSLYYPLVVGNAAFGGTFTSKLMQEVREKRGWSYGAYSRVGTDRQRDAWYMYTFPGAAQAADCIRLELDLLEGLLDRGVSTRDHGFARRYLTGSHCFDVDTAAKRLEPRVDEIVYDLPAGYFQDYERQVRGVSRAVANDALGKRLSSRDLCIVLTATAKDVVPALEQLPGVRSVDVAPHTTV